MDISVSDAVQSEEQLKNTLHSDDKEKLRRKLAQLQREYLKTAQRLQRAERLDAVRWHVRSRISQQNLQDHKEPEVTSNSSSLITNRSNLIVQGLPQSQEYTKADSDASRRNPVIRFTLPSDAACPQTQSPSNVTAGSHRPSPALRLRSRRSRLRLERRSTAEADRSPDSSQHGQEQSEMVESPEKGMIESKGVDAVNESEELFSSGESESPSLLLSHWNTQGQSATESIFGKEHQRPEEQKGKYTVLDLEGKCSKSILVTKGGEQNVTQTKGTKIVIKENGGSYEEGGREICKENTTESSEKNAVEIIQSEKKHKNLVEINEEKYGREEDTARLHDSCTLVEGLLFPLEYYVRTTRRMTVSQRQPDVQAVILSQLNVGRQRRSRGRGRGTNRDTGTRENSDTQTGVPSPLTSSPVINSLSSTHDSAECSVSYISNPVSAPHKDAETCFSPTVTTARPQRGRKKKGRGRGRPRRSQSHQQVQEQTSVGPQPPSIPVSSSQSVEKAGEANTFFNSVETNPEPAGTQPSSQSFSEGNGAPTSCAGQHLEKVYPVFVKTNRPTQMNEGQSNWQSLLLPSSSSPAQTSLHSHPSPFPASLVSSLKLLDIHQDFHLPDDQFASLKLHKLRQVAVESGVEHFSTPSHNTRSSVHHSYSECCNSDPSVQVLLPLSFTPTISNSPRPDEEQQARHLHLQNLSTEHTRTDQFISRNSAEELLDINSTEADVEQHLCAETVGRSTEPVLVVQEFTKGSQPHLTCVDRQMFKVNNPVTGDVKKEQPAADPRGSLDHQISRHDQAEDRAVTDSVYSDYFPEEAHEEPLNASAAVQACNDTNAPQASPLILTDSRVVLKSPPASVNCPFITPHLPSPTPASSPPLPSLGLTPHPAAGSPPHTPSPSTPPLSLPRPHSPSTQVLSPPALSPCVSITSLPPSLPPLSPPRQIQDFSALHARNGQCHRVEPAACLTPSNIQLHQPAEQEVLIMSCTHTLKAAAGGSLVDACCVPESSDGFYIAAAGKWAVCLWSRISASDWRLKHTWTFSTPVINVFPVPDAAELMCVTLGQLEIREVRLLSCSSLTQTLICDGVMQVVVGVYKSRVVTSSHSASGSTLQVFTQSDCSSSWNCQPLVSPGVCVSALAAVDGHSDALIGSDEGGHLFIWNLNTGQLLSRVLLGLGLSQTACLRGYSHRGVLFVLLQHQLLSSLAEEEKEAQIIDQMLSQEKMKTAVFSLVGINPLCGKSILATQLYPPEAWSGRLCEADVNRSSVVGLSQSGGVCVWELGKQGTSGTLEAPEGEDWQLARWGRGGDMLVIGHHNGDVSLLSAAA